jgi:hypothetical protein
MILQELAAPGIEETIRAALEVIFLRLYLQFPHWMDLGSAAARGALMSASEKQAIAGPTGDLALMTIFQVYSTL